MGKHSFYYYVCLIIILALPTGNVSLFDIGFHGSPPNMLIIMATAILSVNYLGSNKFRKKVNNRIISYESRFLLLPLLFLLCFDVISTSYYGRLNYLADRIGTVLLAIIFIVGIDDHEKATKIPIIWMAASFYLAAQNIASQLGLTPVIEGSRVSNPRVIFGVKMPFNYAAGFPGAFGWHGMLLTTGLIFSIYCFSRKRVLSAMVALLCLTSIAMMQSRSSYLATFIALSLYICGAAYIKKRIVPLLVLISPVSLLIIYYFPEIISSITYFIDGFINIAKGNVDKRLLQLQIAIDAGMRHPFLGVGHNYMFNSLKGIGIHNSFLYQMASIGIFGFLLYCYIYFKAFLVSIRFIFSTKPDINRRFFVLALLAILTGMCIELSLFRVISGKEQWLIIYLILLYCNPNNLQQVNDLKPRLSSYAKTAYRARCDQ